MTKLLTRLIINAIALAITVNFVPGIRGGEAAGIGIDIKTLLIVALIFGLVNAFVRPILKMLSCPLVLLTLGLFIFVLNAAMLLLTSAIAQALDLQFYVDGFVPALIGSIVISLISIVLTALVPDDDEKRKR